MDYSELIKNTPLEELIKSSPIGEEQKEKLLEMVPYLNEEERVKLLETVKDAFLLEAEKREALGKEE